MIKAKQKKYAKLMDSLLALAQEKPEELLVILRMSKGGFALGNYLVGLEYADANMQAYKSLNPSFKIQMEAEKSYATLFKQCVEVTTEVFWEDDDFANYLSKFSEDVILKFINNSKIVDNKD